jgi:hypothetical protein
MKPASIVADFYQACRSISNPSRLLWWDAKNLYNTKFLPWRSHLYPALPLPALAEFTTEMHMLTGPHPPDLSGGPVTGWMLWRDIRNLPPLPAGMTLSDDDE